MRTNLRWLTGIVWLAGAWAIPVAAQRLHALWVLPLLVLGLTAGLLRTGRTLLDRLVPAVAVLIAGVAVAGFGWTQWPQAQSVVWTSTAALTLLGIAHIVTGRVPSLPRPSIVDALPIAGSLLLTGALAARQFTSDRTGQLALLMIGEEGAQHFSTFDAVARAGEYLYGRSAQSLPSVDPAMLGVAQGWHFTAGFLDRFLPGFDGGRPIAESLGHFTAWSFAGFALLTLALVWAVLAIGGPELGRVKQLIVAGLTVGFIVADGLPGTLTFGYPAEALGLTLLAVLLVFLVRPVAGPRERIAAVASVLIGLGLVYPFLLPAAAGGAAAWLWRDRSELLRHKVMLAVAGLAAVVAAPAGAMIEASTGGDVSMLSLAIVGAARVAWIGPMLLLAFVGAAVLSPAGRESRGWRGYLVVAVAAAALLGGTLAYHVLVAGDASYYLHRTTRAASVVVLAGAASVPLLFPLLRAETRVRITRYLRVNVHVALALTAVVVSFGLVFLGSDYRRAVSGRTLNPFVQWVAGDKQQNNIADAALILRAAQAFPPSGDRVNVILGTKSMTTQLLTARLATLQSSAGPASPLLNHPQRLAMDLHDEAMDPKKVLASLPGPVRLIAVSPEAVTFARELERGRAPGEVEVSILANEGYGCVDQAGEPARSAPTCP